MATSPYVQCRESLIRRGILSPAARDMPYADLHFQLEQAGPQWAADDLAATWIEAGA